MSQDNHRSTGIEKTISFSDDENRQGRDQKRLLRKRKANCSVLQEISNTQEGENEIVPKKIVRTRSSSIIELPLLKSSGSSSFVTPMEEDEDELQTNSSSNIEIIAHEKLMLNENLELGSVEQLPIVASNSKVNATAAEEEESLIASQESTASSVQEEGCVNLKLHGYDHILMEIMSNLDIKSKLNLSLTSTRFNEILKSHPSRFPLSLNLDFRVIGAIPIFKRCYRKVKIVNLRAITNSERYDRVLDEFKSIGPNIHEVEFDKCDITFSFLSVLLFRMPNLVSFHLDTTRLEPTECEWPPLTFLKQVNVNGSNIEKIAKIIQHVTTLEQFIFAIPTDIPPIDINTDDDDDDDTDESQENSEETEDSQEHSEEVAENLNENRVEAENPIAEDGVQENDEMIVERVFEAVVIGNLFEILRNAANRVRLFNDDPEELGLNFNDIRRLLARQRNLNDLEIIRGSFFAEPFAFESMQLKKLVLFTPWSSQTELENMRSFLRTQTELESVVFNVLSNRSDAFNDCFNYILSLPTIKELRIVFYDSPRMSRQFDERNIVNENVYDLYLGLQGITRDFHRVIQTAVRRFPKVREMHINLDSNSILNIPVEDVHNVLTPLAELRNLDMLHIDHVRTPFLRNVRIPSMKRFIGENIMRSNVDDWNPFFQNNQALEELRLRFCYRPRDATFSLIDVIESAITNLPKLQSVKICIPYHLTNEEQLRLKNLMVNSSSIKTCTFCLYHVIKRDNDVILRLNNGTIHSFPSQTDLGELTEHPYVYHHHDDYEDDDDE